MYGLRLRSTSNGRGLLPPMPAKGDCEHFVAPIEAKRIRVFNEKVQTLAYAAEQRILEIALRSGQVWQLAGVPAGIYAELQASTISSFLKFIAHRYQASPVRTGVVVPSSKPCPRCRTAMVVSNRAENSVAGFVRIFWKCHNANRLRCKRMGLPGTPKSNRKGSRWR